MGGEAPIAGPVLRGARRVNVLTGEDTARHTNQRVKGEASVSATATQAPPEPKRSDFADDEAGRHEYNIAVHERNAEILGEAGDKDGADIEVAEAESEREKLTALKKGGSRGSKEELEAEAGAAVDPSDPAADAAAADVRDSEVDDLDPADIIVAGIDIDYADLGGKKPTGATLKLVGTKAELQEGTGLKKGRRIKFSGEAIVNDRGQKDHHDTTTGQVTSATERYEARVVDLKIEVPE